MQRDVSGRAPGACEAVHAPGGNSPPRPAGLNRQRRAAWRRGLGAVSLLVLGLGAGLPGGRAEEAAGPGTLVRVLGEGADGRGHRLEGAELTFYAPEEIGHGFKPRLRLRTDLPPVLTDEKGEARVAEPGLVVFVRARGWAAFGWGWTSAQRMFAHLARCVPVTGRVLRAGDETPIAGARVTSRVMLLAEGISAHEDVTTLGPQIEETTTDGTGLFTLAGGQPHLCVTTSAPGLATRSVRAPDGEDPTPWIIRLAPGMRTSGRVQSAEGAPAPGARVYVHRTGAAGSQGPLWLAPGMVWREAPTLFRVREPDPIVTLPVAELVADAAGTYVLDGVQAGAEVLLWATGAAGDSASGAVRWTPPGSPEGAAAEPPPLVLEPWRSARVRVQLPDATPVPGVKVALYPEGLGAWRILRTTDAEGRAHFDRVPPGRYCIRCLTHRTALESRGPPLCGDSADLEGVIDVVPLPRHRR